jgi:hypothetical protein
MRRSGFPHSSSADLIQEFPEGVSHMFLSLRTRKLALFTCALSFLAISGSLVAGGAAAGQKDGSELSGPPQMNANYQAREPRLCKPQTAPPNQAQAAVLVQCTMDQDRPTGLFLMQDVVVQIGAPRSYQPETDSNLAEINMGAQIYPLIGSLTVYWCSPVGGTTPAGRGCMVSPTPYAVGKCWKTTYGDWKCNLLGPAPSSRSGLPGPTDY